MRETETEKQESQGSGKGLKKTIRRKNREKMMKVKRDEEEDEYMIRKTGDKCQKEERKNEDIERDENSESERITLSYKEGKLNQTEIPKGRERR